MVSRLLPMSAGSVPVVLIRNALQRLDSRVSNQSHVVSSTAQIFANTLLGRNVVPVRQICSSAVLMKPSSKSKVAKSAESHFSSDKATNPTIKKSYGPKDIPPVSANTRKQGRISLLAYIHKCLPTFEEYCAAFIKEHPEDKDAFLLSANEAYVQFCCDSYKKTYPPLSLEEYKEENLLSFQEYCNKYSWMVKLPRKTSGDTKETILARAYEDYVQASYHRYMASFEHPKDTLMLPPF